MEWKKIKHTVRLYREPAAQQWWLYFSLNNKGDCDIMKAKLKRWLKSLKQKELCCAQGEASETGPHSSFLWWLWRWMTCQFLCQLNKYHNNSTVCGRSNKSSKLGKVQCQIKCWIMVKASHFFPADPFNAITELYWIPSLSHFYSASSRLIFLKSSLFTYLDCIFKKHIGWMCSTNYHLVV